MLFLLIYFLGWMTASRLLYSRYRKFEVRKRACTHQSNYGMSQNWTCGCDTCKDTVQWWYMLEKGMHEGAMRRSDERVAGWAIVHALIWPLLLVVYGLRFPLLNFRNLIMISPPLTREEKAEEQKKRLREQAEHISSLEAENRLLTQRINDLGRGDV